MKKSNLIYVNIIGLSVICILIISILLANGYLIYFDKIFYNEILLFIFSLVIVVTLAILALKLLVMYKMIGKIIGAFLLVFTLVFLSMSHLGFEIVEEHSNYGCNNVEEMNIEDNGKLMRLVCKDGTSEYYRKVFLFVYSQVDYEPQNNFN